MVAIVIGLQAVGVVLMSAMIVAPAAAARQWTDRLGLMVVLSGLFGAAAGVAGTAISGLASGLSTGPVIVLCISAIVAFSLLFAPRAGASCGPGCAGSATARRWAMRWRRAWHARRWVRKTMSASVEIQLIAVVVAAACALPGVFLVLRRMAMMADAISHTVLLGIVLAFFVVADLQSPWLMLGAAAVGVLTVSLVELLNRTRLVKQDAAIGLVFPALFSLAVILISRFARGVHLDVDAVLLGELAFAPFDRIEILGLDLPHALVTMGVILVLNAGLIALFYKELKLSTFDAGLAATLGFAPGLLHYGLMALVSVTAVGAFDAVGAMLVVALMVTPAAAGLPADRRPAQDAGA